jgi:hypothetical protein
MPAVVGSVLIDQIDRAIESGEDIAGIDVRPRVADRDLEAADRMNARFHDDNLTERGLPTVEAVASSSGVVPGHPREQPRGRFPLDLSRGDPMDEWLARFLMVIETVGIVCISGLVAYGMKLRHQRKLHSSQDDLLALKEELDELRAWTQARIGEVEERLDFSERLLSQRTSEPASDKHPTPV